MTDTAPDFAWAPFPPFGQADEAWQAWADGHPVSAAIGLVCTGVGEDWVTCALARTGLPNPNGAVNGGVLAAILDQALALASLRAMRDGSLPNTTNMQVQFLRPAMAPLSVRAWVTKGGRALFFTRAEIHDRDGLVCTTGDGTFAVLEAVHATTKR
jgi:uncharacterized protein (TIGR00369 family)